MEEVVFSVQIADLVSAEAEGADSVRRVSPAPSLWISSIFRPLIGKPINGLILFLLFLISACTDTPTKNPTNIVVKSAALPTLPVVRILKLDHIVLEEFTPVSTSQPTVVPTYTILAPAETATSEISDATPAALSEPCINLGKFELENPDNSAKTYLPGEPILQIWIIQNLGTCTWTADYRLVSSDAIKFGWPQEIPLPNVVLPEETVEIQTTLFTPRSLGTFSANWILIGPLGEIVELDPNSGSNLTVNIIVRKNYPGDSRVLPEDCT